ncbi:MAG: OmpA family protein [Bacteroidota bacterium]
MLTRLLLFTFALLLAAQPAEAQGFLDRIKDGAKRGAERAAEREAARRADRAVTAAFDVAEDAVVCAVTDETCIADGTKQGAEVVIVDSDGERVSEAEARAARQRAGVPVTPPAGDEDEPGEGVWANYDFVSGDRVLFYHDFEGTRTGNFPSRLDYLAGNLDVVELRRGETKNKVLRVGEGTSEADRGGNGCFTVPLPEVLPERYTVEFRMRTSDPQRRARLYLFSDGSDDTPDTRCTYPPNPHVFVQSAGQGLQLPGGYGAATSEGNVGLEPGAWMDIAIAVDGDYWKMYANGTRVANVPRYEFPRAERLHVFMNVYRYSLFLDDLRIAEGGPRSLYDDLEADGFVSTTAIRFDSGSAVLKPESSGILADILGMLEDHEDLRLRIEGHTDSDGSDAANQTLSEERAQAVAGWLVGRGISADRLEAAGFGESDPVADNGTPEGKAENRRSVLRRL